MIGIKLPKGVVLMHSCQKGFQEQREFNIESLVNVIYWGYDSRITTVHILWYLEENSGVQ